MEIKAFKAFRFNADVVGDVGSCIAPPYDVIGESQQDELYRKSPYNIVRITRGKTTTWDDEGHNQYSRAAEYLTQWIAQGAIQQDVRDAIYGYVQDFELGSLAYQRLTFIALGKLEDFGKTVKPHEQVFTKPMLDRLKLKKATAARFGLVFMLYDDPQAVADEIIQEAAAQEPLVDFVDEQGVRHRLFLIEDEADTQTIASMMSDKSCIIADGHHRYTTGLTYWRESGNPAAAHQMMAFTNMRQKGLLVLATHRVVGGVDGFQPQRFLSDLTNSGFTVRPSDSPTARPSDHPDALGIYMGDGAFHSAVLEDKSRMAAAAPNMSEAWRTLDVAVLQKLILQGVLGMDDEKMGNPDYVEYVKDMPNAINEIIGRVDSGKRQIAFFTNPVKMDQLIGITDAGERMPHKSTYFYPKMYTGLTIQKL
jgi:uncharacterized protein (DUF1015 family)